MQSGRVIHERYELDRQLGQGGMAEVWLAHDLRLDRFVAIKFLGPPFSEDPEFIVRLFAEAQSVAPISHPNVVAVLDFGEVDGGSFLVMEYVEGGVVTRLTGAPIEPATALRIVAGAARGAGAAHTAGVIHRDIKPANILLDSHGEAKLADFGIALTAGSERLTTTGLAIGSPHYIAPEQVAAQEISPATDVYSLGVVLYELLTGRPPFQAENITAVAIAHVDQDPTPVRELAPHVDPEIEAVVMACLAKEPTARPADGNVLARALEGNLGPIAVAEATSEVSVDFPPPRRRSRAVAVVATLIGVALFGGLYVAARPGSPGTPVAEAAEKTDEPRRGPKSPKPSPSEVVGSTYVSSPSPSPSVSKNTDRDERAARRSERVNERDDVEPKDEDQPVQEEPDPEPEPEPTPTPESSDEPEPDPEPTQSP